MENSPKSGEGAAEESKELNTQPDLKKTKKRAGKLLKLAGRMILVIRTHLMQNIRHLDWTMNPVLFKSF